MELIPGEPIAAAVTTGSSLCRLCVSPVDQMTPVAQERQPRRIGPYPGSLPVLAAVHAIVDPHKGQIGHDRTSLQHTCIGVFKKPQLWLQPPNEVQAALNQCIRPCQVSWRLCSRAGAAVLCAIGARPNDIKMSHLIWAVPCHQVNTVRRIMRAVPINLHDVPARFPKGLTDAACARTQVQQSHLLIKRK